MSVLCLDFSLLPTATTTRHNQACNPLLLSDVISLPIAQVLHGDLSTVQTSGNLVWPRVLVSGGADNDGDGFADGSMTCSDPIDCTQVRSADPTPPKLGQNSST